MTEPKEKKECERRRDRREIVRGREEKEERRRQRGRERERERERDLRSCLLFEYGHLYKSLDIFIIRFSF